MQKNFSTMRSSAAGKRVKLLLASVCAAAICGVICMEPLVAQAEDLPAQTPAAPPPPPAPDVPPGGSLFLAGMSNTAANDSGVPTSQLAATSLFAVNAPKAKKWQKHSLLTIVVHEDSDYESTGKTDSQKQQDFDLALEQFSQLSLTGKNPLVAKVGDPSKLPEVQFKYNNNRQNQATDQRSDSFSTRIQAEVVDVKPNGNLEIEATKTIRHDREIQVFRLTGECAAKDVGSDDSILSTQVANLCLSKTTDGEVKNGTKSGWFNSILDSVNPF
jgi:flagellar L-ring protein precursor FlgH